MSKGQTLNSVKLAEGKLAYLRHVQIADAGGDYLKWVNDPEVTRFLAIRGKQFSRQDIVAYINMITNDERSKFFAIMSKEHDAHIGNIKLEAIHSTNRSAIIGLMIGDKNYWGRGYGSEAIALISHYAFETLGLNKVSAACLTVNKGSAAAFQKVGFRQEGLLKNHEWFEGKFVDSFLFGLLVGEFEKERWVR